jgi:hypothetical protein
MNWRGQRVERHAELMPAAAYVPVVPGGSNAVNFGLASADAYDPRMPSEA